jgi:hypothetical protein
MDDSSNHKLLVNDEDVEDIEDTEISNLQNEDVSDNSNISKLLGPLLSTDQKNVYSTNSVLKGSLTLRECNEAYGKYNGCKYGNSVLAEFDRCNTKGCISPLRRFDNMVGHFNEFPTGKTK